MSSKDKNFWILLVFLLAGLVIGGLLGKLAEGVNWLWWLSYGREFGLSNPLTLDLYVLKITFSFMININVASIIGIAIAIFWYRRV